MLERTYEYRLYPTSAQQKQFARISDAVRALYNRMLADRTEHFRKTGSWKRLDPKPFTKDSLSIRELEPSVINWTVNALEKAYIQFFHIQKTRVDRYRPEALEKAAENPDYKLMDTDLIGYPKPKKKTSRESWTMGTERISITPGRIQIPNMGSIKIKIHRPIPESAKITALTILKKSSGHFFILVHLRMPDPIQKELQEEKVIGIALEPVRLAVRSDGLPIFFRHQSQAQEHKIAREYEKLLRKTLGSRQYEKQRLYLASLHEKRSNQRKDNLHKIAADIVDAADYIAIEEPSVMRKKKSFVKQGAFGEVTDEAWWTFSEYLRYKSQSEGKQFWRAPGPIPIRDACSGCGLITENYPRSNRWQCPKCGMIFSASLNAARNLEIISRQEIKKEKELNRQSQDFADK